MTRITIYPECRQKTHGRFYAALARRTLAYSTNSSIVDGQAAEEISDVRFSSKTKSHNVPSRSCFANLMSMVRTNSRNWKQGRTFSPRERWQGPRIAHHLPYILADALHALLLKELAPPLRVLVLPSFFVFHHPRVLPVLSRWRYNVRKGARLQAKRNQQLPEAQRHVKNCICRET